MSTFLSRRVVHADVLVPLALIVLPFILFWPHTLALRSWYHQDTQYYFLPYHKLVADTIRAGHLPLWNPYTFAGIPLMADGQTAIWYPPNWLFLVLPTVYALNIVTLAQFSIAGVGMWAFTRRLGLSLAPTTLAALAFMFSGFLTARVVHLSLMAGGALVPWVFWSVERLLQRPGRRGVIIAAGCVALQAVAGHPQVPVYTAVGVAIYVAVDVLQAAWHAGSLRPLWTFFLLAVVYLLGISLAAVQLVPWTAFAALSPRAAGASYEFVTQGSIRGPEWFWWLFPYGRGVLTPGLFGQTALTGTPAMTLWERSAYTGIAPLILCGIGILGCFNPAPTPGVPRQRSWALLAVLVASLLVAAGASTPVGRLVYAVPIMGSLRAYQRAIVISAFAVCAIAGCGAQRLARSTLVTRRRLHWEVRASVFSIGALAGAIVVLANVPILLVLIHRRTEFWQNLRIAAPQTWFQLVLLAASVIALTQARRTAGIWLLVGLVALDLGLYSVSFNPSIRPDELTATPKSVQFLRGDPSQYRIASILTNGWSPVHEVQSQLAISWNIVYHIASLNGFNSLEPRRFTDLLFGTEREDVSYGALDEPRLLQPGNLLLSLLNVKYVLGPPETRLGSPFTRVFTDRDVAIYRNENVFPRAFWAPTVRSATAPAILAALQSGSIDPRQVALVEDMPATVVDSIQSAGVGGPITVTATGPNEVVMHATTSTPRFMVVAEPWFQGWQASIDGQPVTIYRTDYLLRGLAIPAGEHTITFRYRPTSVLVGVVVSGITLLIVVYLLFPSRFTPWHAPSQPESRATC